MNASIIRRRRFRTAAIILAAMVPAAGASAQGTFNPPQASERFDGCFSYQQPECRPPGIAAQGATTSFPGGLVIHSQGTQQIDVTTSKLWVILDCPNDGKSCDLALKGKDGSAVWLPNQEWCEAALKALLPAKPTQRCSEITSTSSRTPVPIQGRLQMKARP